MLIAVLVRFSRISFDAVPWIVDDRRSEFRRSYERPLCVGLAFLKPQFIKALHKEGLPQLAINIYLVDFEAPLSSLGILDTGSLTLRPIGTSARLKVPMLVFGELLARIRRREYVSDLHIRWCLKPGDGQGCAAQKSWKFLSVVEGCSCQVDFL